MDLENIERINELPVFPLATVLFPGAILPLHIFEERYKELMRHAVENDNVFGLSYFKDAAVDRESLPDIGSVGCVAKIQAVMPLEEGRMNIVSMGVIRYRVLSLKQINPFLLAEVELFTDDPEIDSESSQLFDDLYDMAREFLANTQVVDALGTPIDQNLPDDPEAFSLFISSLLPINNNSKQVLLEMTSTRLRLMRLNQYVTSFISDYNEQLKIQEIAKGNGHGKVH